MKINSQNEDITVIYIDCLNNQLFYNKLQAFLIFSSTIVTELFFTFSWNCKSIPMTVLNNKLQHFYI